MTDVPRPLPGDAPAEPDPMIGRTLADRYRIDELIARGGMARVYRARDERLERDVAIKVLAPPYADDSTFTGRFLDEGRAAASISHPSLVHVYDSGTDGAAHFIVMELLDHHRTLRAVIEEAGTLPREEVLRIGVDLLAGLRVVHDRGLVHCDVKSSNVMLGPGPAKLIDFGIATAPHEGIEGSTSIGSLQSMSPEQLHGDALTPASDLFSLGTVLYEALTGQMPYPGATPEAVSAAHVAGNVRPPSTIIEGVPGRLDEAILQSLRRDPASRFRSAEAMTRALEAAAAEVSSARADETRVIRAPARPAGYVPPPAPPMRPTSAPVARGEPARQRRRRQPASRGRSSSLWGMLGSLLVLGAAALVVIFVVVPLLNAGRTGGPGGNGADPSPSASPAPTVVRGVVPDTVGLPTDEAIEVAREAGLDWTVRCNEDPDQDEGIIDQEPPAGTEVPPGSPFTMFSARVSDCR
jgi:serine/threonine-protein kinase